MSLCKQRLDKVETPACKLNMYGSSLKNYLCKDTWHGVHEIWWNTSGWQPHTIPFKQAAGDSSFKHAAAMAGDLWHLLFTSPGFPSFNGFSYFHLPNCFSRLYVCAAAIEATESERESTITLAAAGRRKSTFASRLLDFYYDLWRKEFQTGLVSGKKKSQDKMLQRGEVRLMACHVTTHPPISGACSLKSAF